MTNTLQSGRPAPGRHEPRFEYPSTARAARQAARNWFQSDTLLSALQFRDQEFEAHCVGRTDTPLERRIRRDAFHQAFAKAIGQIVVEEGRYRAAAA